MVEPWNKSECFGHFQFVTKLVTKFGSRLLPFCLDSAPLVTLFEFTKPFHVLAIGDNAIAGYKFRFVLFYICHNFSICFFLIEEYPTIGDVANSMYIGKACKDTKN